MPNRTGIVTQQFGARRVLEHQALRPAHTQIQTAMSLMRMNGHHVKITWKGSRVTLTESLPIDITMKFLTVNVSINPDLSGGGIRGDTASRVMVDGLCDLRWQIFSPLRWRSSLLQFFRLATAAPYSQRRAAWWGKQSTRDYRMYLPASIVTRLKRIHSTPSMIAYKHTLMWDVDGFLSAGSYRDMRERERVLFIGTQFSILYTSMYSPA